MQGRVLGARASGGSLPSLRGSRVWPAVVPCVLLSSFFYRTCRLIDRTVSLEISCLEAHSLQFSQFHTQAGELCFTGWCLVCKLLCLNLCFLSVPADVDSVKQYPYRAVANALEVIPRTLAQNCGTSVGKSAARAEFSLCRC